MKIEYVKDDIFNTKADCICHGCNKQGIMGSGIALQIKTKYPEAYKAYYSERNNLKLGQCIWVNIPNKYKIINAITQENYGRNKNIVYVSYDAIRKAIKGINRIAKTVKENEKMFNIIGKIEEIAFPKIGAGLANGDWNIIASIIEEESVDFKTLVYIKDIS